MAEEHSQTVEGSEVSDRGLFDFKGKKEEKSEEEALVAGVEKVNIEEGNEGEKKHSLLDFMSKKEEKSEELEKVHTEEEEEEKKHSLLEKIYRDHSSSSSSSSDEDNEEKKEKKRKKKGLKEKIKEKQHTDHEAVMEEVLAVTPEADGTAVVVETVVPDEENKGFVEKIKEKLPGHPKKTAEEAVAEEEVTVAPPPPAVEHEGEKKSFIEKIKEKLPGYHKSNGEVEEKLAASQ